MFKRISSTAVLAVILAGLLLVGLVWAQKSTQVKKQGWVGVYLQELTPELKESMDLKESTEGVLVNGVVEDSPAEKAGIEEGDVIISFDGKKVGSTDKLTGLVRKTAPGTEVEIKVIRDGEEESLNLTIGESSLSGLYNLNPEKLKIEKKMIEPFIWSFHSGLKLGVAIQDLTEQLGDYFGIKKGEGALITEIEKESPAEKAGLKAGDIIVQVDNEKVSGSDDVRQIISEKEKGDKISLKVMRDKRQKDFSVTLAETEKEYSFKIQPDIEKTKNIELFLDKLQIPEAPMLKGYSSDESKLKRDLNKLKKEMEELKKELDELKEELKR
ncbi:MAG: PDZ domain-containing protein [candidate division Zixibacteria bacterium]|nr:PDZ domain-containing protein [candidate division Zixibacteria bacterium]